MNALQSRSADFHDPPGEQSSDLFDSGARSSLFHQIGCSIGDDAADKLIADFGGRRLYIPIAPSPGDLVSRSIGLIAALQMARLFGGDRVMVPTGAGRARRRARILAMRADHVSISRIAHELRCTERHVYKVLALSRDPSVPSGSSKLANAGSSPAASAERIISRGNQKNR
jgi:Mor family transcriptional regulator